MQPTGRTGAPASVGAALSSSALWNVGLCGRQLEGLQLMRKSLGRCTTRETHRRMTGIEDWLPRTVHVSLSSLIHGLLIVLLTGCDTFLGVHGRVTDRRSGGPIVNAAVTFYGSGMPDTGYRITTGSRGQFDIRIITGPLPRVDSFIVTAANYSTVVIRPTQRKLPTLEVQLTKPLYSESSRLLGELTQRPER
jgi:hypothetical protein